MTLIKSIQNTASYWQ